MWFEQTAASADLGYQLSRLISLFRTSNPANEFRTLANTLKPDLQVCAYYAPTASVVGHVVLVWEDLSIVLLQGCSNLTQAQGLIAGINTEHSNLLDHACNFYLRQAAIAVQASVTLNSADIRPRLIVAGHSLGGATSEVLALRLIPTRPAGTLSLVTFGSPRPGFVEFANAIEVIDLCRWMTDTDPVPQIPPRQDQSPVFFALLSQRGRLNANQYVQPHGGTVIYADGDTAARDVPNAVTPQLQFNIASWLLNLSTDPQSPHSINTYNVRLFARRGFNLGNPPAAPTTHGPGMPVDDSPAVVRSNANHAVRQLNAVTREGNVGVVVIPPAKRFTYSKIGGVWCVFFDESFVAVGPTRKKAGGMVNKGNQLLRRLQTMGVVDPNALPDALQAYLSSAKHLARR